MVCQCGCCVAWKEDTRYLYQINLMFWLAAGVIILTLTNPFQRSPLFNFAND